MNRIERTQEKFRELFGGEPIAIAVFLKSVSIWAIFTFDFE